MIKILKNITHKTLKTILLSFILLMAITAQSQTLEWIKITGGEANSITTDAAGNIYVTGGFREKVDFNPGLDTSYHTPLGYDDIYVQKFDASGNFLWMKTMGGTSSEEGREIRVDALGNIYIIGDFAGTVDFDPGAGIYNLSSEGDDDIFIQKLDASGNFLWVKSMGGFYDDSGRSIAIDSFGNVYASGYFKDIVDFNPGTDSFYLIANGDADMFIQKLDASGNFLWAKSTGGNFFDNAQAIAVDKTGNIYTTGVFGEKVDFDPGADSSYLISRGKADIFVRKLDPLGNFLWAKSVGGKAYDIGNAIAIDSIENVYIVGDFLDRIDLDPGEDSCYFTSHGNSDFFIQKLDSSGNFLWAKATGGDFYETANAIVIDKVGNIYVSGGFTNTMDVDFGQGVFEITPIGLLSVFVLKIDASSNFLWTTRTVGPNTYHYNHGMTIDRFGNVYTVGVFDFIIELGGERLEKGGNFDSFIQKIGE